MRVPTEGHTNTPPTHIPYPPDPRARADGQPNNHAYRQARNETRKGDGALGGPKSKRCENIRTQEAQVGAGSVSETGGHWEREWRSWSGEA